MFIRPMDNHLHGPTLRIFQVDHLELQMHTVALFPGIIIFPEPF